MGSLWGPGFAKSTCILLVILLFAAGGSNAFAGWQAGAGTGYDSNINRSVDNKESDTYLSGYASLNRQPSGESRLGWFGAVTLEGVSFTNNHNLNYAMISGSAGMTCFLHAFWRVDVAPFLEARGVNDSEQSALAFGGKVSMRQQIKRDVYTGQYYLYRDSRADVETYSFTEHVFGVFLGVNWTEAFFTEAYYEFSRGDSFRTDSTISTTSAPAAVIACASSTVSRVECIPAPAIKRWLEDISTRTALTTATRSSNDWDTNSPFDPPTTYPSNGNSFQRDRFADR